VWRLSGLVRLVYYIGGALGGVAWVLFWLFMLDPTVCPAASFLHLLGYNTFGQVIAPGHLSILFAMIAFWTGAGGWIVVMYGALNNIPLDVMEAARIDGAGAWRIARYIQIPMLRKWIVYMVILAFAAGTQLFVEPQLISEASLGVAGRDYSLNQLSYDFAFQNNNVNYAAAISVQDNPLSFGSWHALRENWDALTGFQGDTILLWLRNSALYAFLALAITLAVGIPAGYALAMMQFPGRRALLVTTLVVMLMPATTLVIPLFLEVNAVHLIGSVWSVVLPYSFYPFGVFLTYIYFSTAHSLSLPSSSA
jgi:ABC-type glycerol-3-phosphate transport system permease component